MTSSTAGPGRALIALSLLPSLLFAVYLGALPLFLPRLGDAFGLGVGVQGRLFPASFGGSLCGVFLCGYLSDRWGRKPVLLGCLAAAAVGLLLFARASGFPMVLAGAFLGGGGAAAAQAVATALLTDRFPERRSALINAVQVAFGVGAIAGPLAAQATLASLSWRGFFAGLALVQLSLLAAFALLRVSQDGTASDTAGVRDHRATLKRLASGPLIFLCLSAFLYAGAEVALFSWTPTYLETLPGGGALRGLVVSAFWLPMTFGRLILPFFLARYRLARLRALLAGGAAASAALTLFAPTPILTLAGVAMTGLLMSGLFSLILAEGGERYRDITGTALSLIIGTSGAGAGFVPWLVGALRDGGWTWQAALGVVPVACVLVVLLTLPSLRSEA